MGRRRRHIPAAELYLETFSNSDYLAFDEGLLKLLADRGE